jgi:hypothetical protein
MLYQVCNHGYFVLIPAETSFICVFVGLYCKLAPLPKHCTQSQPMRDELLDSPTNHRARNYHDRHTENRQKTDRFPLVEVPQPMAVGLENHGFGIGIGISGLSHSCEAISHIKLFK